MQKSQKVALVHEYLTRLGGAERVLSRFTDLYPEAPIYTLLYDSDKVSSVFDGKTVYSSFLQTFPHWIKKHVKLLAALFPTAIESFDLSKYDLVLSSSNSFAKGVMVNPSTIHICYCHAPMSYIWDGYFDYQKDHGKHSVIRVAMGIVSHYLRVWDRQAADRVDYFIANSKRTQERIQKYYRRSSQVIYPPVNVRRFDYTKESKDYFLIVSQLTSYKNIHIVVEAFNKLGLSLVIIGDGPERKRLEQMSKENIQFKGFLSDNDTQVYFEHCRAFIFAGLDDFGIAPVEAMAAGKPVLALRGGGVLETMIEGVTGEFFDAPIMELVADGVKRMVQKQYDSEKIRKHAETFSEERFIQEIQHYISDLSKK